MMESSQRDKMNEYLDQLLAATKSKTIDWFEVNPTTYTWVSGEKGGRINIQQIGGMPSLVMGQIKVSFNYVLQVLDNAGRPQLILQGPEDKVLNEKLDTIFQEIRYAKTQKAIDFLGSIIPKA